MLNTFISQRILVSRRKIRRDGLSAPKCIDESFKPVRLFSKSVKSKASSSKSSQSQSAQFFQSFPRFRVAPVQDLGENQFGPP
uniref:Uncharacterized protein n=1 Tax=Caenorhabditis japonica TaxID=281687 RepID=A0A8R1IVC1_CAEJA